MKGNEKEIVEALLILEMTPGEIIVKTILESLAEKYLMPDKDMLWKMLTGYTKITDEVDEMLCNSFTFEYGHWSLIQKMYDEAIDKQNTITC